MASEVGMASVYITLITVVGGIFMEWMRRDTKNAIKQVDAKVEEAKITRLESTANIMEGLAEVAPSTGTKEKAVAARQEVEVFKGTGSGSFRK